LICYRQIGSYEIPGSDGLVRSARNDAKSQNMLNTVAVPCSVDQMIVCFEAQQNLRHFPMSLLIIAIGEVQVEIQLRNVCLSVDIL